MNDSYTDISVVLDKSGSMEDLRDETISGYNGFLAEQKKLPGKCLITEMQFDTSFNLRLDGVDIHQAETLSCGNYRPGGYTALLDAIGNTMQATGKRLAAMPEAERPAKVLCVIITDGLENSSEEFKHQQIMEMIERQTKTYKWNFVFLGANQDAIQTGAGIGIAAANAISTAPTGQGVHEAYAALSANTRLYRMSMDPKDADAALCFSPAQRATQRKAGAQADKLNSPKA